MATRAPRAGSRRGTQARRAARPRPRAAKPRRAAKAAPTVRPKPKGGVAPGMQPVNTYLTVRDVGAAMLFYERAFGFKRRYVMAGPDGSPMHAEMTHRESVVMMGPESPLGNAPDREAGTPVTLYVYVPNVDRTITGAITAGARLLEDPKDQFWGDRTALLADLDGHRWMLATFKRSVPREQSRP